MPVPSPTQRYNGKYMACEVWHKPDMDKSNISKAAICMVMAMPETTCLW